MAANWIKLSHATPDKPEVAIMAEMLGIDHDAVVGKLVRLWIWADQQTMNGYALSVTKALLNRVTYHAGMADALEKVGWLVVENGDCSFPNFDRHNGETSKARGLAQNRMAKMRAEKRYAPSVTKASPEKRREDSNHSMPRGGWSLEQVVSAGFRAGITPAICKLYHDSRMAVEWVDHNGNPIKSMPHDLAKYAAHYQNNEARHKSKATIAPKAEGVWHLEKRIEAAQKEIDRINSNPDNKEPIPDSFDRRLKAGPAAKVKALKATVAECRQRMAGVEEAA
jgi:hypothetical protein